MNHQNRITISEQTAAEATGLETSLCLLLWMFYGFLCIVFAMPLCASVYMCLVVTCWERADLLALVCGV